MESENNQTPEKLVQPSQSEAKSHGSHAQRSEVPEHEEVAGDNEQQEKKSSKIKQLWTKTGLDVPTILIMIKAAIPPTIATAMYQATPVAKQYGTLGYLVSIMSILGFCIMPRAKFLQTMLLNLIAVCIGAAVALLSIYCSVQARLHTTPPGAPLAGYNSSASAVSAIWLFFQVYLVNTLKSARPQFTFPAIIYAIFALVASTYGPNFPTMAAGKAFARTLLLAFLTGFGLATGVSLVILPTSTRLVIFKEITGYMQGIRGVLKAQNAYLKGMQQEDMFLGPKKEASSDDTDSDKTKETQQKNKKEKKKTPDLMPLGTQAAAYKAAVSGLVQLHGKLFADLPFAKREIAFGKLSASDIKQITKLLRDVLLPLIGLSSIMDIFERVAKSQGWDKLDEASGQDANVRAREQIAVKEWQTIMQALEKPFQDISRVMDEGIEHTLLRLELIKPPKAKQDDVEKNVADIAPGHEAFAERLKIETHAFYTGREVTLAQWCEQKGISLEPGHKFETDFDWLEHNNDIDNSKHERDQRQLFAVLYMEYLLWAAAKAILELVKFADSKHEDGTMTRSRLIAPGLKQLKKWVASVTKPDNTPNDDHKAMFESVAAEQVSLGEGWQRYKDPEHLPPSNRIERLGNQLRKFPRFMRSEHSAFGFRAACATLSVGIIAFLHDTYAFFMQQRLVWAMIMIAFSMTRTSGESAFNFILRIFGTFVAMVASYVIYYIVDGHTAGVIVFLFIWVTCCFYIVLKVPRYVIVGILSAVTAVLIIGYELEVKKIGIKTATSNGQPYYPVYQLAPYRLATVAGGLAVAYFWTVFPYPVTEHGRLRHDLGAALFLLANHYSIVSETVKVRVTGTGGNPKDKNSPIQKLSKAQSDLVVKSFMLISGLRTSSEFTRWQISVGGRFPKKTYDEIIERCSRILSYTSLMGYASSTFDLALDEDGKEQLTDSNQWLQDFRRLLGQVETTSQGITSILSLLSSSVMNAQPLPPFLQPPEPFRLVRKLEALDRDILSIRHIAEPGYAAFAVLQIASRSIVSDIQALTRFVFLFFRGNSEPLLLTIGQQTYLYQMLTITKGCQDAGWRTGLFISCGQHTIVIVGGLVGGYFGQQQG